jgi:hypothetical protein
LRSGAKAKDQGWRLDYFLVSEPMMKAVIDSEIHKEYDGSDHCPLSLTIDLSQITLLDGQKPKVAPAPIEMIQAKAKVVEREKGLVD